MTTSLDDFPSASRVSTEDLLRAMPLPIAVVGNGPIAKPYGEVIDSHATVIRFNNFRLAGHEASVGTKVTHWCQNGHYWNQRHRHSRGHSSTAHRELELIQATSRIQFHG